MCNKRGHELCILTEILRTVIQRGEGTGSGRDDELEIIATKVGGISSSSSRNASHSSGGIEISSLRCKEDVVGQSRSEVPSFKNANPSSNREFGDRDRGRLGKRKRGEINFRPRVDLDIGKLCRSFLYVSS